MKLKTTRLVAASAVASQGATTISLSNFSGATAGLPIIDNAGVPIGMADAKFEVGTFDPAFAATLGGLDVATSDQAVIDAFTPSGGAGAFSINGLFNRSVEADGDGSLGAAGTPLYALITYTPAGEAPQAMVLGFAEADAFPAQNAVGQASVDLGRTIGPGDVVFGGGLAAANTSTLPAPFQKPEFSQGLSFDGGPAIPEPSTSLLAGLAGLALMARRRR